MTRVLRWPVHPPPLADETLSSWLLRVARANASTLSSWLASINGAYDGATSLDTTEDETLWKKVAHGAGLAGGAAAVRSLTFLDVEQRLGAHATKRWLLSVNDRVRRPKHGFCVGCLASDASPYLRRAWRLEWVRWCPRHACRLDWACRSCGAMWSPWQRSWERILTTCGSCGRDLIRTSPREEAAHATAPTFVMSATRQALAMALGEVPAPAGESPFAAAWCLQKWAEAVGVETWPSWLQKVGLGTPKDATPPSDADAVAWSFALAWHLATGPKWKLAELAARHQATFNRAIIVHCPPSLAELQRPVHAVKKITSDDVEEAVDKLFAADVSVTYLAVAEALGVSPNRISGNAALRAVVDDVEPRIRARWVTSMRERLTASRERLHAKNMRLSRANLAADASVSLEAITRFERETGETLAVSPREEYAKDVAKAISALRARGDRITSTAVARELGRERSFIEKHPALKRMVHAARDAKPTVEEVRRACRELREQGAQVTTVQVAKALGRHRSVIERAENLRAVVDAERNEVRLEVEGKIRAATRTVTERGEKLTVAAVCRELGQHRSFIEKRGRLKEIVRRVKQP